MAEKAETCNLIFLILPKSKKIGKLTSFELDEIASAFNNRCSELCYREGFYRGTWKPGGFSGACKSGNRCSVRDVYFCERLEAASWRQLITQSKSFLKIAPPGCVALVRITTKSNVLLIYFCCRFWFELCCDRSILCLSVWKSLLF